MPFTSRSKKTYVKLHSPSLVEDMERDQAAFTRQRRPKLRRPKPPKTRART